MEVEVTDVYAHGDGERTLTFELVFSSDGDVSAEATNEAAEALIASVEQQFGDQGVRLR